MMTINESSPSRQESGEYTTLMSIETSDPVVSPAISFVTIDPSVENMSALHFERMVGFLTEFYETSNVEMFVWIENFGRIVQRIFSDYETMWRPASSKS